MNRVALGVAMFVLAFLPTSATAATELVPDLGMARLSDFHVDKTSDGRRLLRYSTVIVNVGAGPFELHGTRAGEAESTMSVTQRIRDDSGGSREVATPARFVFGGDGHHHWHVQDLETSELIRLDNGVKVGTGAKRGFCFFDNVSYRLTLPGAPSGAVYGASGCGTAGSLAITMGLSVGWGDLYRWNLPDQYVDITGLAAGRYRLLVTADAVGWFVESNNTNNATWVDLQLRGQGAPRILAYGPAA